MTTLGQLTDEIKREDRAVAPGSESGLWGEYLERMRLLTGVRPLGDYDRDVAVPDDEAAWWHRAYRYAADHPGADFDEIKAAADGGH